MTRRTKTMLAVAAGAGALGVIGWVWYQKAHPALTAGPITTVTLGPGQTATPFQLSLAQRGTLSVVAPTGSTLGTVTITPSGVLTPPTSGAKYEWVATAAGTANVTGTYTDSSGKTQTSTFQVVVS